MIVKELIEELKKCDENLEVYAEGKPQIVRIFKTWNIDFIESPLADMRGD